MKIRADVTCYHCGYISAELEGEREATPDPSMLKPASVAYLVMPRPGQTLRCVRCGGPCYLDDVTQVKEEPASMEEHRTRKRRRRTVLLRKETEIA